MNHLTFGILVEHFFLAAILQPVLKAVFNDLPLIKDAITQAIKEVSPAQ